MSGSVYTYRLRGILRHGNRCAECNRPHSAERPIEVHHIDLDRRNGKEDNLRPLCRPCHVALHNQLRRTGRRGRNLPMASARFDPDLSAWLLDHASRHHGGNQSAAIREAVILYRAIVENELEPVVKRMVRTERAAVPV